jgi:hypothetical protein
MYLGVKHFRMPQETLRVAANAANPLSDSELTSMHIPVLLLMGDREVYRFTPTVVEKSHP